MNRQQVLDAAIECVTKTRQDMHGNPENSFRIIANMWSAYLAEKRGMMFCLDAEDVAWMMVLLKVARSISNPKNQDNGIDAAGYAALAIELANNEADDAG